MPSSDQLEAAIAAQESLRPTLGDDIVDAAIAALRAQLAQRREVVQQRKLVTVLFMDVVGSTALMQGRDPEETMAIMDSALARLAEPVADHGGRVTRYMGDGFMAVFGLPAARENEPEMAVRSGLAITDAARLVAAELEADHGIGGFTVRVGINTGLVVSGGVTEAEDTLMGDAVNLAARLESAAPPGGVLVSNDTLQHVRNLFEVEPEGTIDAKGFSDPVAVYRVLGRTGVERRRSLRGVEGLEIPMVGRGGELARLTQAFEQASYSGKLQRITVVGEAGLGKTRLLEELRTAVETTDHLRLEARASLETRDLAYAVIRDLLERRFGIRNDDDVDTARGKLVDGVSSDLDGDPEAEVKAHFIGQMLGYDFVDSPHVRSSLASPQQIRSRAVMYLTEVVERLARRHPLLMIIEDLHWADAGSFDVLDGVVEGLVDRPVLLVAAARLSLRDHRPSWGEKRHQWLELTLLPDAAAEELVSAVLRKVVDCPDDLRRQLVDQAGGNPYYLEETIRMLIGDGVIVPGEEAWTVDQGRYSDLRIPPTLTGVIQARLDSLPASQRTAVQQASVVGRVFWDAAIAHLASAGGAEPELRPALEGLRRREIVHERATSAFSGAAEYTFHHETVRAVAYEGVLLRVRRDYHSMVADWLIANSADRAAEMTGLIAGHLERGGRDGEALEYYCEAAEAALAAYAVETADAFYGRALALTPASDVNRRRALLLGREKTLAMRGLWEEQRLVLDELWGLVATDSHSAAIVGVQEVWFHYRRGDFDHAVDASRKAVQAAAQAADPALEARARAASAWALMAVDDIDGASPEAELALARGSESGDTRAHMTAYNTLALIALRRNDFSAARRHAEAYLEMARRAEDLERETTALNNAGVVETQLGNYEAARSHFERMHQIAIEVGDRFSEATSRVNLAWAAAAVGEWSIARDHAREAVAGQRRAGHADAVAEGLMWLGHAEHGLGDLEAARAAYGEALKLREELGQTGLAMGARAGLARTALTAGDLETAQLHARVVVRYLDDGGALTGAWEPFRIHLTCYEVLSAAGDGEADRVLERARRQLLELADRVTDESDRRSFLERVPWHRQILELAHGTM